MKKRTILMIVLLTMLFSNIKSQTSNNINMEKLELTNEWDKVFPKSDKVSHCKVTFINRYGITLAADLYKPINKEGKLPAIAVSGPFGAVKEQCSGLYAQEMAITNLPEVLLIHFQRTLHNL